MSKVTVCNYCDKRFTPGSEEDGWGTPVGWFRLDVGVAPDEDGCKDYRAPEMHFCCAGCLRDWAVERWETGA